MAKPFRNLLITLTFTLSSLIVGLSQPLQAETIHALLVADSLDYSIGDDTIIDLSNMAIMIDEVATATKMDKAITVINEENATTQAILEYLNTLAVEQNDVVILYFSMHGFRTPSKTNPWPNIYFGQDRMGIDLDYIVNFGKQKLPRLLISIADVCNNELEDDLIPMAPRHRAKRLKGLTYEQMNENYKNLFLYSRGTITISGSIPGEYSWSYKYRGGAYTLGFLSTLKNVVATSTKATWEQVLSNTYNSVIESTKGNGTQHPQYQIDLKL